MLGLVFKRFIRGSSKLVAPSILATFFVLFLAYLAAFRSDIENATAIAELSKPSYSQSGISVVLANDFSANDLKKYDQEVKEFLKDVEVKDETFFIVYQPITNMVGQTFQLVGISEDQLQITNGRTPSRCDQNNCEVAVYGSDSVDLPKQFKNVGEATLDTTAISDLSLQPGIPVYVTTDITGLLANPHVSELPRTAIWASKLGDDFLQKNGITYALQKLRNAGNTVSLSSADFAFSFPEVALTRALNQAQAANERLIRLGIGTGLLALLAIAALGQIARENNEAAARVWEQITGKHPWQMPWVSASLVVLPPAFALCILAAVFSSPIEYSAIFIVLAFFILVVAQTFSPKWAYGLVALVIVLAMLVRSEASIISGILSVLILGTASRLVANFWTKPIELNTARRIELVAVSALVGVFSAAIASWVVTSSSLDKHEVDRISFMAPLESGISGLQSGVFQEISLAEYKGWGQVVPIEVLNGNTSGNDFSLETVEVVGLPKGSNLPDLSQIGGPDSKALNSIGTVAAPSQMTGSGKALEVSKIPEGMEIGVWILDADGQSKRISSTLPIGIDVQILGFEIYESSKNLERREHASGEGNVSIELPSGNVELVLPNGKFFSQDVTLRSGSAYFPVDKYPVKLQAIVNPEVAKVGDSIVLNLSKSLSTEVLVVGTAARFPTIDGNFALINRDELNTFLAQSNPELIRTAQVWIDGPLPITDSRFSNLSVVERSALESEMATNPVRIGIRSFYLTVISFLIFGVFISSALITRLSFRKANFPEWIGRGFTQSSLKRSISKVILSSLGIAITVGGIVGATLTAKFMFNESFTWSGLLAVPPIATSFSIWSLIGMFLILLAAAVSGIFLEGMRKND